MYWPINKIKIYNSKDFDFSEVVSSHFPPSKLENT